MSLSLIVSVELIVGKMQARGLPCRCNPIHIRLNLTRPRFMLSRANSSQTTFGSAVVYAAVACAAMLSALPGCSRQNYRLWADRDAYRLIKNRQCDPQWQVPDRPVEPQAQSRLADKHDPDCGPLPPDDPAAACYMRYPNNTKKPVRFWDQRGYQGSIDDGSWESALPYDETGAVKLDKQLAVDLALLHNRQFQTRVEQMYVQALQLSNNQFEFEVNWFGGSDGAFVAGGEGANAVRGLGQSNNLGVTRNFASGGQLVTNLVNSFTWQLGGNGNSNFAAGSLLFGLTQPLLRGAFRHVRTESLTQAQRDLLYDVRDFARFRREFYFDIVRQYLALLSQTQSVRNEEENLFNLELNLEEHNVLFERDLRSSVQVDQVFQQFQAGRLSLINSRQALQSDLDQFKFALGLPARVEITFDEGLLEPFQLNSDSLLELQTSVDGIKESLLKYVPPDQPPEDFVGETYAKVKSLAAALKQLKPQVDQEFKRWVEASKQAAGAIDEADRVDNQQQIALQKRLEVLLEELDEEIGDADEIYEQPLSEFEVATDEEDSDAVKDWKKLETLIVKRSGLKERVATLVLLQTQIRLFSIELKPLELEEEGAVRIALQRRLDLKNSKAAVTDAFRRVEIAADQLESDLSVTASAEIGTDNDNAFRLDSDANEYNLGVNFDGPLNRFEERNGYRVAQIAYQQQRRQYMADEDAIVNSVRLNLRQLRTNRFGFQIARQQLITATRQVEQAQFNLRTSTSGDSSLTQDLLQALQNLRNTKNDLISSWINYETSRIAVFVDLESLQLNEQGVWINEEDDFDVAAAEATVDAADDESLAPRLPYEESASPDDRDDEVREDEFRDNELGEDELRDTELLNRESLNDEFPNTDTGEPVGPINERPKSLQQFAPPGPDGGQSRAFGAGAASVADRRAGGLLDLR